jgi:hypothetical protein
MCVNFQLEDKYNKERPHLHHYMPSKVAYFSAEELLQPQVKPQQISTQDSMRARID